MRSREVRGRRSEVRKLLAVLVAALLVAGCQVAKVSQPLTETVGGSERDAQMEFWHQLATRPLTSNDEAFHGLLLYMDKRDDCADYAARVDALRSRKLIPNGFKGAKGDAVERGTLAVAIVRMLDLRGGISMTLLGPTERYSTRLLIYRSIYPDGSPNQTFSGAEFVGIIGRVEDYQRGNNPDLPAALLPGEAVASLPVSDPLAIRERIETFETALEQEEFVKPLMLSMSTDPMYLDVGPTTTATTSAATTQAADLVITIDGIEGEFVDVRSRPSEKWQRARVGMKLGTEAEFRTGPRSAVRFVVPPDQTFTVDRVTTMRIVEAMKGPGKVKTDVDMMYGRVRHDLEPIGRVTPGGERPTYRIEEPGLEHDTTIRSPNSTLAVRGTRVGLYDQPPFVPQAVSLVGTAQFRNARRQLIAFGSRANVTNRIKANQSSPVQTAMMDAIVDPGIAWARQPEDMGLIRTIISRGGVVGFDRGIGIPVIHGGVPPTDAQLVPVLPGRLSFVLRWTGDANLDLAVANQAGTGGELVFPASGLTTSRSGGRTAFDHRGGISGGIEVAYWKGPFPSGFYSVGVNHTSGTSTAATVDVFFKGQRIDLFDPSANGGSGGLVSTFNTTVGPGETSAVIAPVGVEPPLSAAASKTTASKTTVRRRR